MLSTDANTFGKINVQTWHAAKASEAAVKSPERLPRPESIFVLPKTEAPRPNLQNAQPNPMTLLQNVLNFSSMASYAWGNKVGSQAINPNKANTTSFVEEASWDEEYDPITGEFKIKSVDRRIPIYRDDSDNPFQRSLNIIT